MRSPTNLARACAPRFLRLAGKFNVRGGIYTTVVVERRKSGWQARRRSNCPDLAPEIDRNVGIFRAAVTAKTQPVLSRVLQPPLRPGAPQTMPT